MKTYITLSRNQGSVCREDGDGLINFFKVPDKITLHLNDIIIPSAKEGYGTEQQIIGEVEGNVDLMNLFDIEDDVSSGYFIDYSDAVSMVARGALTDFTAKLSTAGFFHVWYISPHTSAGDDSGDFPDGVGKIVVSADDMLWRPGERIFCHMRNWAYHTDKALEIQCVGYFHGKALYGEWLINLRHPIEHTNPHPGQDASEKKFFGDTWDATVFYDEAKK